MSLSIGEETHILTCERSRPVLPARTVSTQYCGNTLFAVWPERNLYLKNGLIVKFLMKYQNFLSNGFVFVDMSLPNLRCFVNPHWIDSLIKTEMHIVIITDATLAPLANYWLKNRAEIRGILYSSDPEDTQACKIKKLFRGEHANTKVGDTLNQGEFNMLAHFTSGNSLKEIIELEEAKAKEIYVRKLRLESKLGYRINTILAKALSRIRIQ